MFLSKYLALSYAESPISFPSSLKAGQQRHQSVVATLCWISKQRCQRHESEDTMLQWISSTQIFVYDKFQLSSWQEALLLNCWNTWIAILRHWHMHRRCSYDRDESMRFRILNNSVSLDCNLSNMIKIKKSKSTRDSFTTKWKGYVMGACLYILFHYLPREPEENRKKFCRIYRNFDVFLELGTSIKLWQPEENKKLLPNIPEFLSFLELGTSIKLWEPKENKKICRIYRNFYVFWNLGPP